MPSVKFQVIDRSILLPGYRRLLINPLIPHLPRRLSPNLITHFGHLVNLLGVMVLLWLWPERGWPYFFAAAMLQLQVWCDNADGAHARHTGQSSAYGELLDHGLDILNVAYIGYLTALTLSVSPIWWVVSALLPLAAVSATYWEQTETGTFILGRLNQIEIGVVTGSMLIISGIFGRSIWTSISFFGLTLQQMILIWVTSTIVFGIGHSIYRTLKQRPLQVVWPVITVLSFGIATLIAAGLGVISTPVAVILSTASNVFFSMRMLTTRFTEGTPRIELSLLLGCAGLAVLALNVLVFERTLTDLNLAIALAGCAVFGGYAVLDTRSCIKHVRRA